METMSLISTISTRHCLWEKPRARRVVSFVVWHGRFVDAVTGLKLNFDISMDHPSVIRQQYNRLSHTIMLTKPLVHHFGVHNTVGTVPVLMSSTNNDAIGKKRIDKCTALMYHCAVLRCVVYHVSVPHFMLFQWRCS